MTHKREQTVKHLTESAVFVSFLIICSWVQLPLHFSPVPITLQTMAILLCSAYLPLRQSLATITTYLFLGSVGVPVFSGFQGGIQKFTGPTGGFLVGFLPAVIVFSFCLRFFKRKSTLPLLCGALAFSITLYLFGSCWYSFSTNTPFLQSFILCVVPFIVGDILKILLFISLFLRINVIKRN